ncbi:hypothetical protein ACVWWD_000341 [Mesorhizobium sp. URHB0026]
MGPWELDHLVHEQARLYQRRAEAQVADLRSTIDETRRVIQKSRKLLDRLAAKPGAIVP